MYINHLFEATDMEYEPQASKYIGKRVKNALHVFQMVQKCPQRFLRFKIALF